MASYMWRRPLCVGNKRTWTISVWIKRNKLNAPTGTIQGILGDHTGNTFLRFNDDGNGDGNGNGGYGGL